MPFGPTVSANNQLARFTSVRQLLAEHFDQDILEATLIDVDQRYGFQFGVDGGHGGRSSQVMET